MRATAVLPLASMTTRGRQPTLMVSRDKGPCWQPRALTRPSPKWLREHRIQQGIALMQVNNPARARLERGELSLGVGVRAARTVDIAKMMKSCGYDWLFIDLEHGTMSLEFASTIAVAALDTGIAPIVRVPFMQHHMATRALDGGALGIVMPHVD